MSGNPYRDEKGHLTTRVNDGGPCYHNLSEKQYKQPIPRNADSDKIKAGKLLGVNFEEQQEDQPPKMVFMYNDIKLRVKNVSTTENNERIVELEEDVTN